MQSTLVILRIVGNALLLIGYATLLNVNLLLGLCMKILGGVLLIPFLHKNKLHDVIVVAGVFMSIDIHQIIKILFL